MKRLLRTPALLCLGSCLVGTALAGCSHSSGPDFASMSKDEQVKAMHNLPPEEVAIQKKMLAGILAAKNGANRRPGAPPSVATPGAGQH